MQDMLEIVGNFCRAKEKLLQSFDKKGASKYGQLYYCQEHLMLQLASVLSTYKSINSLHVCLVNWYLAYRENRISAETYLDYDTVNEKLLNLERAEDELINTYYAWLN